MQSFLNILRWSAFCSNQNSSRYGNWKESRIEEKIQSRTARWKTTESHYREKHFLSNLAHKRKIEKLEMA